MKHHLLKPFVYLTVGSCLVLLLTVWVRTKTNAEEAITNSLIVPKDLETKNIYDWPHWRGPNYDGVSAETGWSTSWPKEGPKQLWKAEIGTGFSSVTVSNGRLYTMGNVNKEETIFCFDSETGKTLWKHSYPCGLNPKMYEGGPGATPAVDGNEVYTLGNEGQIFCFDTASGKIVWSTHAQNDLKAKYPNWGFEGSPLILDQMVILNVGASGVALDKKTGKKIWETGPGAASYATPIPFTIGGTHGIAVFAALEIVGLDASSGKEFWKYSWSNGNKINAADPIISDNKIFISTGYGKGCALLDLSQGKPSLVWESKEMKNQTSSSVLWKGYLYGYDGQIDKDSPLKCLDFQTGKVQWVQKVGNAGSVAIADGKLILLTTSGELVVAEASPEAYKEITRAQVIGGKCWSVPVLSNGRIYARNAQGTLVCLDVKK